MTRSRDPRVTDTPERSPAPVQVTRTGASVPAGQVPVGHGYICGLTEWQVTCRYPWVLGSEHWSSEEIDGAVQSLRKEWARYKPDTTSTAASQSETAQSQNTELEVLFLSPVTRPIHFINLSITSGLILR